MTGGRSRRQRVRTRRIVGLLATLSLAAPLLEPRAASAMPPVGNPGFEQGMLCRAAIRDAERTHSLPPLLLSAIARVESGRADPISGHVNPWPWSINAEGHDYVFDTKGQAIAFAQSLQARGVRSFDVGCMQINMLHHASAFQSLDEAFDPAANARYAADFLTQLKDKTGSWEAASAAYHSLTPEVGAPYKLKVDAALIAEGRDSGSISVPSLSALTATLPTGSMLGLGMARPFPTMAMPPPRAMAPVFAGSAPMMARPTPLAMAGNNAMMGRTLDSYRMRPVAVVAPPPAMIR